MKSKSALSGFVPHYDIAVIGDATCGKSSIIKRFISGNFVSSYIPTAAEVHLTMLCNANERIASLQLFDTAGGFEFPMMLRITITKCQAFFVVYSVGSLKSLEMAKRQIIEIASIKGKHFPCVLVGNKKDLEKTNERKVSFDKGVQTAVTYGCSYIEVSAMDDENIDEAFCSMVKTIENSATIKNRLFRQQRLKRNRKRNSIERLWASISSSFENDQNNRSSL